MDASPALPPHSRTGAASIVRSLREAAGLSPTGLASMLGTSTATIRDLETNDDELFRCYSVSELCLVAAVLDVEPVTLLNCPTAEPPITGTQLVEMIRQQLTSTHEALTSFEDRVGWRLEPLLGSPDQLLSDLTIEALQGLSAALGIDWRRVIAGLPPSPDPAT